MTRIRVNTEDLRNKAKDFDSAAEAFKRAGDDILAAAMAMPSYEGQLSGPARKMGYEVQKQSQELSAALAGDAELLRKTAQAFEDIDNQSIKLLGEYSAILADSPIYGGPGGETDDGKGGTHTEVTEIVEKDGSVTTITITRTVNPDGTITEVKTVKNSMVFDRTKQQEWNDEAKKIQYILSTIIALVMYIWAPYLKPVASLIMGRLFDALFKFYWTPTYEEGDTMVTTLTTTTTEYPDGTRQWESTTSSYELTDRNGVVKNKGENTIDSTGAVTGE
jgi:uncharacterized protein YukE